MLKIYKFIWVCKEWCQVTFTVLHSDYFAICLVFQAYDTTKWWLLVYNFQITASTWIRMFFIMVFHDDTFKHATVIMLLIKLGFFLLLNNDLTWVDITFYSIVLIIVVADVQIFLWSFLYILMSQIVVYHHFDSSLRLLALYDFCLNIVTEKACVEAQEDLAL